MKKEFLIIIICLIILGFKLPAYSEKNLQTKLQASDKLDEIQKLNSRNKNDSSSQMQGQMYSDPNLHFSIMFPSNWTVKNAIASKSIVIKAIHHGDNHKFAALNIYAWKLDGSVNVATMSPREIFNLTYAKQGTLLNSGTEKLNGHHAVWLKMKVTTMGITSYALAYILVRNNVMIALYGITMFGNSKWFDTNEPAILKSIRSFKFTR